VPGGLRGKRPGRIARFSNEPSHTTPVPEFDILFERRESPVVREGAAAADAGDDRARLARMDRAAA
jgi:hypothetical protein